LDKQLWETFTDIDTLGRGHFAKVKRVEHQQTGEHFAMKILDKTAADNDLDDLVREFLVLKSLRHPNIIRLYAAYETPHNFYLVTELAMGGELMQHLGTSRATIYSEEAMRRHTQTILQAVQYMHSNSVAHRDLKPENVLLSDMTDTSSIKIVDLGLSRTFEKQKLMRTVCGTHKYLAPELVACDRGMVAGYGKAVDIWGVGLLAYIMLYGSNPFARDTLRATHEAILKCNWSFPPGCNVSEEAKGFIQLLLVRKAEGRPTADEALESTWFSPSVQPSTQMLTVGDSESHEPVQQKLEQWNKERILAKTVKGVYRRLGLTKGLKVAPSSPRCSEPGSQPGSQPTSAASTPKQANDSPNSSGAPVARVLAPAPGWRQDVRAAVVHA